MSCELLKPFGLCNGLNTLMSKLDEIINEHNYSCLYIIGSLAHNEKIINKYKNNNCVFISISDAKEFLTKLNDRSSIVIFSAHGHNKEFEEILNKKFIQFYDLTCFNIKKYQTLIDFYKEKEFVFISNINHEEALALNNKNNVKIFDPKNNKNNISNKESIVLSQTTISDDLYNIGYQKITKANPNILIYDSKCSVVSQRIKLLDNLNKKDIVIVVGSNLSSNVKSIYQKSKSLGFETYLINDINDINFEINLEKNYKLISGCSTLNETVIEIYEYINKKLFTE